MVKRYCEWCPNELPVRARRDARFCQMRCQVASWRKRKREQLQREAAQADSAQTGETIQLPGEASGTHTAGVTLRV